MNEITGRRCGKKPWGRTEHPQANDLPCTINRRGKGNKEYKNKQNKIS